MSVREHILPNFDYVAGLEAAGSEMTDKACKLWIARAFCWLYPEGNEERLRANTEQSRRLCRFFRDYVILAPLSDEHLLMAMHNAKRENLIPSLAAREAMGLQTLLEWTLPNKLGPMFNDQNRALAKYKLDSAAASSKSYPWEKTLSAMALNGEKSLDVFKAWWNTWFTNHYGPRFTKDTITCSPDTADRCVQGFRRYLKDKWGLKNVSLVPGYALFTLLTTTRKSTKGKLKVTRGKNGPKAPHRIRNQRRLIEGLETEE